MRGHRPVMLAEVLSILEPWEGCYLDATFGGGGHTRALLDAGAGVHVVALDCDPEAEARAGALREVYGDRLRFVRLNFGDLVALPEEAGLAGALFDLGLSSFQLDSTQRGFSFRQAARTDMRMDPQSGSAAAEFLETASREQLVEAIRDFGEEPRWRAVVDALIQARGTGKLAATLSLAEVIRSAAAWSRKPGAIDAATRSFQGIRMAVNRELEAIERALPEAFRRLAEGGVLCVISFHSLEDRLVKRFFRAMAGMPQDRFDYLPQQERVTRAELLTRKPLRPGDEEVRENPRARSARLRALRKIPA